MEYERSLPDASETAPDLQRYLPEVEAQFESEEAAIEFLRTLWNIMCAFVDLGWGVDSIHFALPELAKISSLDSAAQVSSPEHRIIKQQAQSAFAKPSRLGDS